MPWNDNANPGPWGGSPSGEKDPGNGGEGPRRPRPPRSGPGPGPRLARWAERLEGEFRSFGRGGGPGGGRGNLIGAIAAGVAALWLMFGSVYVVQANERAVVTRFGAWVDTTDPGLHFHLPWPIEGARTVQVTTQRNTVIGGEKDDALMLTGDENIVDLDFVVQWHVNSPSRFLFQVEKPEETVKAVAESAMREVVGRSELQAILTNGRGQVQAQTLVLTQRILDGYNAGISVDSVQIQRASPPQPVIPAYQDLNTADQERVSAENEGQTYYNRVVNEAKGNASKIVREAEGYRQQVILGAQGEASRFDQVYEQYRRAPAVTRQRLYIEAMQTVLQHSNKVIVDAKGSTAPIILPPDVFRQRPSDAATAPTQPSTPQTNGVRP